ncbi:MAG: hypothetical protein ABL925_07635 [Methylococcales bacterium]
MDKYRQIKWNKNLDAIRARNNQKTQDKEITRYADDRYKIIDVAPQRANENTEHSALKLVLLVTAAFLICGLLVFESITLFTTQIAEKTADTVKETTRLFTNTFRDVKKDELNFQKEVFRAAEARIPKPQIRKPYAEVNGKVYQLDEYGRYRPGKAQ